MSFLSRNKKILSFLLLGIILLALPITITLLQKNQDIRQRAATTIWAPALNTSWQWQLTGTVDQSVNVQMYDIDGFDNNAAVVASLHAKGARVVCYFSAGSSENWRPDYASFPASVKGKPLDGWAGENWLDIRNIAVLGPIMQARMDMCKEKGFDAIEPDNIDAYTNNSGFPLTAQDQLTYNKYLAEQAHARGLSIALKNDNDQGAALVPFFDFAINEECFSFNECAYLSDFVKAGKAAFQVEYTLATSQFCDKANGMNINALKKDLNLTATRTACRESGGPAGPIPTTATSPTLTSAPTSVPKKNELKRGVNLFGGWQGMYGGVDTFAPPAMLDYFKAKGLNTFRVGFSWEHLQPTLTGPFDTTYLAKMDSLVANAKARGQQVAFVPLPGQYKGKDVGTKEVPQAAFNDLWIKLATHYKNESAIWGYNLINEPNMGDTWNTSIAPSAISAIRTVDMSHPIIVPTSTGGYGHYFTSHLAGLPIKDPANNLIYEAHFYFDSPPNGQYVSGYDVPNNNLNIGVERAKGFVEWCKTNNQTCFAGEYGVPGGWTSGNQTCTYAGGTNNDPRWLSVLDTFLTYLDQNNISGTYWAGGPYGDINSVGPFCTTNGTYTDAPQMAILQKHLASATSIPSPTALPITPAVSPSVLPSVIPTTIISSPPSTVFEIKINLHGIGTAGDNANATGGNLTPKHVQRTISLLISDQQGQLIKNLPGVVVYSPTKKLFEGTIGLYSPMTPGTYRVRISSPGYLTENVPGIYQVSQQTNTLQLTTLITGDAYLDNKLDILDYNVIMTCWLTSDKCDTTQKTLTDLNDDGITDIIDYNLFIRELSVQRGI